MIQRTPGIMYNSAAPAPATAPPPPPPAQPPAPAPSPWNGGAYTGQFKIGDVPDWLLKQNVPQWLSRMNQGKQPADLVGQYRTWLTQRPGGMKAQGGLMDLYRNYLGQNPTAQGNQILFDRYGRTDANGYKPPAPATPPPGPATPPPPPPGTPGTPGAPGAPPPGGPAPGVPGAPGPASSFTDIYDVYKSAIPVMDKARDDQISSAMARAGFSGNRYGSAAIKTAGDIGAQTALQQNQLLTQLMYDQGNKDLDRSLAATNTSLQAASLEDQMARNRLDSLFNFGKYEQDRQDNFSRMAYADWNENKYGMLPLLMQFASSQSGGQAPTPYAVQKPGSPGAADWLTLLAGLF